MENLIIKRNFKEIKQKAKRLYESIGRVWCPILGEHIIFTKVGFRHLERKSGKRRSLREQTRRFLLLPLAKEIIENSAIEIVPGASKTTYLKKRHGARILAQPPARFWTLSKTYGTTTVIVILRQIEAKEKHFFSIYDRKSKHQKTAT